MRGPDEYYIGRVIFHPKKIPAAPINGIPAEYQ